MPPPKRILIVDDEAMIRKAIHLALEKEGYEVVEAETGAEALRRIELNKPDLILLDIMLPDVSGFDVCRDIRKAGLRVPIIILSAKTEEIDVVVGLEIGADDYITKPFRTRELLARIAAHLRKARQEEEAVNQGRLEFKDLAIDLNERRVFHDSSEVMLTHTEFDLLAFLASNARKDPQPRVGLRVPDRNAGDRRVHPQPPAEDRARSLAPILHPRGPRHRVP